MTRRDSPRMSRRAIPALRRQLGTRLRALREAQGLSQQTLGVEAGLTGKFIGEVERGEKSVSLDSLGHVARALGVRLHALLPHGRSWR